MIEIQFTTVTNTDGILTKTITLDDKGGIIKRHGGKLNKGYVETQIMAFRDFGAYLRTLELNQAIVHGVTGKKGRISLTTARKLKKQCKQQSTTIARTKDFFQYPDGPGLAMFDYDPKPGQAELTPDEFLVIIHKVFPDFKKIPTWTTPSTGACIFDLDGQQLTGEGAGFHMYFPFDPADKIPEFSQWLFKKLWLEDYGNIFITKAGSLLERTLFDAAVFSPERLDFVAGAKCINCVQRLPDPEYRKALEATAI